MRYSTCSAANKRREKLQSLSAHQQRRQNLIQQLAARQEPAELIDILITTFPDCPPFASYAVDRLLSDPTPKFVAAVSHAVAPLQGGQG